MNYSYDGYGWLSPALIHGRTTSVVPPTETDDLKANFTGVEWVLIPYTSPSFAPPVVDPRMWWIYPGPFKDRLGMDALAIYASNHGACKAVAGMMEGRLYIDLKDPKNTNMLNLLIAVAQPAADAMFAGSGPMTVGKRDAILNTPTAEAERYVKGLL